MRNVSYTRWQKKNARKWKSIGEIADPYERMAAVAEYYLSGKLKPGPRAYALVNDISKCCEKKIEILEEALKPFAEKECIRSGTVVLMKDEVINARKALGWKNPNSHGGKDGR